VGVGWGVIGLKRVGECKCVLLYGVMCHIMCATCVYMCDKCVCVCRYTCVC
jgi:hypothetical protein